MEWNVDTSLKSALYINWVSNDTTNNTISIPNVCDTQKSVNFFISLHYYFVLHNLKGVYLLTDL